MRAQVVALSVFVAACHQAPRPRAVPGVPNVDDVRNAGVGMFFDCDTPAHSTAQWSLPVGNAGRVQGALFIATTREDRDWVPNANVMLIAHDGVGRVGLRFELGPRRRTLEPTVRYTTTGAAKDVSIERLRSRAARDLAFELEWDERRARLRLEHNAPWLEIELAFVPERFALQCSTGETVFHAVSVTTPMAVVPPPITNASQ